MKPFEFKKLTQIAEVGDSEAKYLAGGSNLVDLMKKGIESPDVLLDINAVLSTEIDLTGKDWKIGAGVKNSVLAEKVNASLPLLSKAILAGASAQIRNMATVGGNLLQRTRCPYFYDTQMACNKRTPGEGCAAQMGVQRMSAIVGYSDHCIAVYPSDMSVALAALDAKVFYVQGKQQAGAIPFGEFHTLPGTTPHIENSLPKGALITHILVPDKSFKHCSYIKVRDRESYAFALVSVAAALDLSGKKIVDARLASGGIAHKPWRWWQVEKFLIGKEVSPDLFKQAADLALKEVKPLPGNAFKVDLLRGALQTALMECIA